MSRGLGDVYKRQIFSDKTLIQMAVERPSNKEEMLAVSGVGESKFEKYGEQFLACLAER